MPRQISLVSGGCVQFAGPVDQIHNPIHAQSSEAVELPVQFLPWLPSSIIHACSTDHFAVVVVILRLTHACWGWLGGGGTEGPSAETVCARKIKSLITLGMEHAGCVMSRHSHTSGEESPGHFFHLLTDLPRRSQTGLYSLLRGSGL